MSDMPASLRPPDAGTRNEWAFVGGKVVALTGGLPAVLGRPSRHADGALVILGEQVGRLVITPHQARALMEVLPAAINHIEPELCQGCGNPVSESGHGASEYGGCV